MVPLRVRDDLEQAHDVENSAAFHGGTARDAAKSAPVGRSGAATAAFGDVQGDGHRGSAELVGQGRLTPRDVLRDSKRSRQEFDRALVDIQLFVTEHAAVSGDTNAAGAWFSQRKFSTVLPQDEDGDEDEDEDEDGDCSIRDSP